MAAEYQRARAHGCRDRAGVAADHPIAQDQHFTVGIAHDPAQQHALALVETRQKIAAHGDRHVSRHGTHGR